jgi:hypothetical protein
MNVNMPPLSLDLFDMLVIRPFMPLLPLEQTKNQVRKEVKVKQACFKG